MLILISRLANTLMTSADVTWLPYPALKISGLA